MQTHITLGPPLVWDLVKDVLHKSLNPRKAFAKYCTDPISPKQLTLVQESAVPSRLIYKRKVGMIATVHNNGKSHK